MIGTEAIRSACARLRVPQALLRIEGRDRIRLLHNLTTNDIKRLAPGSGGCLSAMTERTGKTAALLLVRVHRDHVSLSMDPALRRSVQERILRFRVADDVRVLDATDSVHSWLILGPDSRSALGAPALPLYGFAERGGDVIQRVPGGFLLLSSETVPDAVDITVDEYETFRIESGLPAWGKEVDETVLPTECGLETDAVSYSKGCYLGQEVIQRVKTYSEAKQELRGLFVDGGPATPGPLLCEGQTAGRMTSSTYSPTLGRSIALGIVRKEWKRSGNRLQAGDRPVTVVDLPFLPLPEVR